MRVNGSLGAAVAGGLIAVVAARIVLANGGPFVVKYPNGDPAAKGVLARLDPTLKPARETRLRVVKEDLTILFGKSPFSGGRAAPPLAHVTATYTIENPTGEKVDVDFGFPILRGIYVSPMSMSPVPAVTVRVDETAQRPTVISNSVIYGIIRQRARETIEAGIAKDRSLATLVALVRRATESHATDPFAQRQQPAQHSDQQTGEQTQVAVDWQAAREMLRTHLITESGWDRRDATLLVEYVSLNLGKTKHRPHDRWAWGWSLRRTGAEAYELTQANLGPLGAIGEQKATQLFAQLASKFDTKAAAAYEAIFSAWGGDVRERSVDLQTGNVRPREISVKSVPSDKGAAVSIAGLSDPTIYARVDYFDENAKISDTEKAACKAILKNLPVVFTFAPMNILHYQVGFPAHTTRAVTVSYQQYAYLDTGGEPSYQLAYVVHPASLWDDFGPIDLKIQLPEGVPCRASVPLRSTGQSELQPIAAANVAESAATYAVTLTEGTDKEGELFIAIHKAKWDAMLKKQVVRR
jgi:hypothetical protein